MPTTAQMLVDYPELLLRVIGELRGAFLDAADTREQAIELLAAQITDPTYVQMAYQETVDLSDRAQEAVETLLKEGGEIVEAQFSREYGAIRQMGPAKLERETPWLFPESVAELLYYYGLLGRGFRGKGQNAHTIIYLPSDIVPWLPHPQGETPEGGLPVRPAPPPNPSRILPADDTFLEDVGTLLGFLRTEGLRLTDKGPHSDDIDELVKRFQLPFSNEPMLDARLALLLHLANRLGWLRRGDDDRVALTGNRVRGFLESSRTEQRQTLWQTWRQSSEWNDLCRTPQLECTDTGNWSNDPLQTRNAVIQMLATLQPGMWYSSADVLSAIKETNPDFQRPTGHYDTWYIRDVQSGDFLKGFDEWDRVEGALLRFLINGPLHWLCAFDLAEPSAGDDMQLSLSRSGARWLDLDGAEPEEPRRQRLRVEDDFSIIVPHGTSLAIRFRIERFAQWQSSYPHFAYQITQRSLARAADAGIGPQQIRGYLNRHCHIVSAKVDAALERLASPEAA